MRGTYQRSLTFYGYKHSFSHLMQIRRGKYRGTVHTQVAIDNVIWTFARVGVKIQGVMSVARG